MSHDVEHGSSRRRRFGRRALVSMLATASLATLVNAGAASAYTSENSVVNRYNGMCLDVAYASLDPGAQVVQASCWGGLNQRWTVEYYDTDWWTGRQYYRLVAAHSGQCLDVDGGSQYDGARISQWHCYWGSNQQFELINTGHADTYRLKARHSGKCVAAEASFRHAAAVSQRTCSSSSTQQWTLR